MTAPAAALPLAPIKLRRWPGERFRLALVALCPVRLSAARNHLTLRLFFPSVARRLPGTAPNDFPIVTS
jgi:hypothetical protein